MILFQFLCRKNVPFLFLISSLLTCCEWRRFIGRCRRRVCKIGLAAAQANAGGEMAFLGNCLSAQILFLTNAVYPLLLIHILNVQKSFSKYTSGKTREKGRKMKRKYRVILIAVCLACIGCLLLACTGNRPSDKNNQNQKDDLEMNGNGEILISVFWPPMKGFTTAEQYDLLKEAGIDLLEWGTDPIFTDPGTLEEMLKLCGERGIQVTVADSDFTDLLGKTDEQLRQLARRYREYDCVAGFYLKDEPSNANPYGRIARIFREEMPGCLVQLNMLPMGALQDPKGHAEDWINAAGPENMSYLSYDQYPFGLEAGSVPQMFANMNFVREIGLKYGVDTALYLQSVGVINGFRRPTVSETRYHASAALAYGYKNLKYFTYMTPVDRGNEEFTDAIIRPDGTKSDTFDGIADINRSVKKVSKILGNLDALEIYHHGRADSATVMLPEDWYLSAGADQTDFLVSLMKDRVNGRNYLMIVNKDYTNDAKITFRLQGVSALTDVTGGAEAAAAVPIENGAFTAEFSAGAFRLYQLEKGVDLTKPYADASAQNLALEKPIYASYSVGENGYYACRANDGTRFSSASVKGWRYQRTAENREDPEIYLMVDLKRAVEINRVDLYPTGAYGTDSFGTYFPVEYSILYSEDGKEWCAAASHITEQPTQTEIPTVTFDTVSARYVKLVLHQCRQAGGREVAELAEIEIYHDTGTQEIQKPFVPDETITAENNAALHKPVTVSSSVENWGWMKSHLTDGNIETGWSSQIKIHMNDPFGEEWLIVDLQETYPIDLVLLYPRQDGTSAYFPKSFKIEVSEDRKNWTEAARCTEAAGLGALPRACSFSAVPARYIRVTALEMTDALGGNDGYLFQLSEVEVYRQDRS